MMPPALRGPANLATFASSYLTRAPFAAGRDGLALAAAVWGVSRAVAGAIDMVRIGLRARRAPVLHPGVDVLADVDALTPVCTLVSDTHVTAAGHVPCELDVEPWQWPGALPDSDAIAATLRRVLDDIRARAPSTVIWCGDEVDTGAPDEWARWREVVDAVDGLHHRLVPGNHDICFNRPHDDDPTLARRVLRERAFQRHAGRLADFPIVDTMVTEAGIATVILLDSCRLRSRHVLSNAIGMFGDEQLDELARILACVRGPVLCIAHHHVWRDARFAQPDEWYNVAVDADRLAALLFAYRRRGPDHHVLVCHGHRHTLTTGALRDGDATIGVVGLPSTTLGDKSRTGQLDAVPRYAVAGLRANGGWAVALRGLHL